VFKRFKISAVLSAIVVTAVVGVGTQAFAAGSVVPDARAGSGSAAISGYAVTDVDYTFGQTGTTIDAVSFNVDRAADTAKVTLDAGATWHACTVSATAGAGGKYAASCAGVNASVASATELTVVAKSS
jgi:hypothetical protein